MVPLLLLLPLAAFATKETHVRVKLEHGPVRAGQPVDVWAKLQIKPGWHIYWRNPGDTGLPTRMKINGAAAEVDYLPPRRFGKAPLVSYGWEGETVLRTRLASAQPGQEVKAEVRWLACKKICIPGKAVEAIRLQRPSRPPRANFPPAAAPAGFRARQVGSKFQLSWKSPSGKAWFYPYERTLIDHSSPQPGTNSTLTLTQNENPSKGTPQLYGVLVIGDQSFEINQGVKK